MKFFRKKRFTKSIVSLMLVITMMSGIAVASVVPTSAIGGFLFGEVKAWVVCYAKKGLIKGVDAVGSAAGMNSEFTDYVDTLILGPSVSTAHETLDLCNEILQEVKLMEQQINDVQNSVNEIITTINVNELNDNYLKVYSGYVTKYSTKLAAIEKLTADEIAYAEAVQKGEDYVVYDDKTGTTLTNQEVIDTDLKLLGWYTRDNKVNYNALRDEMNEINDYLCNIIDDITGFNGSDVSTVANKDRSSQPDKTGDFYEAVMAVAKDSNKFATESQAYDFASSCVNSAIEPVTTLLYYTKMVTEFLVSCETNCVDFEGSNYQLSSNHDSNIEVYNTLYRNLYNKTTNAVNEMLDDFTPEMNKMMREYDVKQTTEMNYKDSDSVFVCESSLKEDFYLNSKATVTKPEMNSYVFMPNGADTTYMLLDTTQMMVKDLFSVSNTLVGRYNTTTYYPNQNFYNLTASKNGYYNLPGNHNYAYNNYSDLLTNEKLCSVGIKDYMQNYITDDMSDANFYNYMFTKDIHWDEVTHGFESVADNDVFGINTSKRTYTSKDLTEELDIKQKDLCNNKKNPMLVLEGKNSSQMEFNMTYSSGDNIPISVYANYQETYEKQSNGDYEIIYNVSDEIKSNTLLHPTDMMYVKIKPDEGCDFSLDLYNSKGEKIHQIATQNDITSTMTTDDGWYVFPIPMTYQNCSIKVSYT